MIKRLWLVCFTSVMAVFLLSPQLDADEYLNGIEWKEPAIVTPGTSNSAPSDAVVLFDGKDNSAWDNDNWKIVDGALVAGKGDIKTKASF